MVPISRVRGVRLMEVEWSAGCMLPPVRGRGRGGEEGQGGVSLGDTHTLTWTPGPHRDRGQCREDQPGLEEGGQARQPEGDGKSRASEPRALGLRPLCALCLGLGVNPCQPQCFCL